MPNVNGSSVRRIIDRNRRYQKDAQALKDAQQRGEDILILRSFEKYNWPAEVSARPYAPNRMWGDYWKRSSYGIAITIEQADLLNATLAALKGELHGTTKIC